MGGECSTCACYDEKNGNTNTLILSSREPTEKEGIAQQSNFKVPEKVDIHMKDETMVSKKGKSSSNISRRDKFIEFKELDDFTLPVRLRYFGWQLN